MDEGGQREIIGQSNQRCGAACAAARPVMADVGREGWRIHYEIVGPDDGRPLLVVAGMGEQIGSVEFPDEQCALLADAGFRVIRVDNRDNGMSIPEHDPGEPDWVTIMAAAEAGTEPPLPYRHADMAADLAAVIDAAGAGSATVLAASMGTAVARVLAIRHPERVQALMLVMGMSGAVAGEDGPLVPEDVIGRLLGLTLHRERADAVGYLVEEWRWLWGPTFPFEEAWVTERVSASFDRSYRPEGIARNMATMVPSGLWDSQTAIDCPVLVMHGDQDPCCPPEHGQAIADRIPTAQLWEVEGMGHAMHRELWDAMTDRLDGLVASARTLP